MVLIRFNAEEPLKTTFPETQGPFPGASGMEGTQFFVSATASKKAQDATGRCQRPHAGRRLVKIVL